jgi:hypothetical protein
MFYVEQFALNHHALLRTETAEYNGRIPVSTKFVSLTKFVSDRIPFTQFS